MEMLKSMKEMLMAQVQAQMGNLQQVDTKELGEAIDMIKDLSEATYYCSIVKAMEEKEEEEPKYYTSRMPIEYRDMDREMNRMYYPSGNGGSSTQDGGTSGGARYYSTSYPMTVRDYREGRSPISRKMYMESKESHKDPMSQMKELENYMKELSTDITEMIEDATPEEKQILRQKLSTLMNKI